MTFIKYYYNEVLVAGNVTDEDRCEYAERVCQQYVMKEAHIK